MCMSSFPTRYFGCVHPQLSSSREPLLYMVGYTSCSSVYWESLLLLCCLELTSDQQFAYSMYTFKWLLFMSVNLYPDCYSAVLAVSTLTWTHYPFLWCSLLGITTPLCFLAGTDIWQQFAFYIAIASYFSWLLLRPCS